MLAWPLAPPTSTILPPRKVSQANPSLSSWTCRSTTKMVSCPVTHAKHGADALTFCYTFQRTPKTGSQLGILLVVLEQRDAEARLERRVEMVRLVGTPANCFACFSCCLEELIQSDSKLSAQCNTARGNRECAGRLTDNVQRRKSRGLWRKWLSTRCAKRPRPSPQTLGAL
jgi:hypothetical protein